jgi:hypothetical protein
MRHNDDIDWLLEIDAEPLEPTSTSSNIVIPSWLLAVDAEPLEPTPPPSKPVIEPWLLAMDAEHERLVQWLEKLSVMAEQRGYAIDRSGGLWYLVDCYKEHSDKLESVFLIANADSETLQRYDDEERMERLENFLLDQPLRMPRPLPPKLKTYLFELEDTEPPYML